MTMLAMASTDVAPSVCMKKAGAPLTWGETLRVHVMLMAYSMEVINTAAMLTMLPIDDPTNCGAKMVMTPQPPRRIPHRCRTGGQRRLRAMPIINVKRGVVLFKIEAIAAETCCSALNKKMKGKPMLHQPMKKSWMMRDREIVHRWREMRR